MCCELSEYCRTLDIRYFSVLQVRTEEDAGVADGGDGGEDGDDSKPRNGLPWDGTDRDYMYEELLGVSMFREDFATSATSRSLGRA